MSCENCDYTDIVVPVDYSKSSFMWGNRIQYHNWKLIGMQLTHPFLHGDNNSTMGVSIDDSGRLKGVASGCKIIEDINQNNHIIGRGSWYFRAKVDGSGFIGSGDATYGIVGHCQSPGLTNDARYNIKPGAFDIEGTDAGTLNPAESIQSYELYPYYRGWGTYQGPEFCSTNSSRDWHLAAFYEIVPTYTGEKEVRALYYQDDEDCGGEKKCICDARNSQLPGRFTSWITTSDCTDRIYRTCETELYPINGVNVRYDMEHASSFCLDPSQSIFTGNDILGISYSLEEYFRGVEAFAPLNILGIGDGPIIKLTSLPSCNHFNKVFSQRRPYSSLNAGKQDLCYNSGSSVYDPDHPDCYYKQRCERAVIRISPYCFSAIQYGTSTSTRVKYFDPIERHYDRWDSTGDGIKIFDEIYNLPNMKVRVLAHKKSEIMKYIRELPGYEKETWMEKRYVTGGDYTSVLNNLNPEFITNGGTPGKILVVNDEPVPEFISDYRGCECTTDKDGSGPPFPIRPYYNTYTYCANDFSCEKRCRTVVYGNDSVVELNEEYIDDPNYIGEP